MTQRYFFHTSDGGTDADTEGTELPSVAAARSFAIRYAGQILASDPDTVWDGRDFRVHVTDEDNKLLFTVIALSVDSSRPVRAEDL